MSMFRRRSRSELEADLLEVERQIGDNPLASERVVAAQSVVERNEGEGKEKISSILTERGLPSLEELGRVQLRNTTRWWRLHRQKKRLTRQLER